MSAKYNNGTTGMQAEAGLVPQPLPILLSEVEQTDTALGQLRKALMSLEDRLGPISQPTPSEPVMSPGQAAPRQPVSPLTSQLQSQRVDILSLCERVSRMLTYLDL